MQLRPVHCFCCCHHNDHHYYYSTTGFVCNFSSSSFSFVCICNRSRSSSRIETRERDQQRRRLFLRQKALLPVPPVKRDTAQTQQTFVTDTTVYLSTFLLLFVVHQCIGTGTGRNIPTVCGALVELNRTEQCSHIFFCC